MLEVRDMSPQRTLSQWFEEYQKDGIDMNPEYQRRGGLWPRANKQLLINSVLNSYDIPKIYLSDFTYANTPLNESNKPYAVIDGKQRLETFFEFFEDKLPLGDTPVWFGKQEVTLTGLYLSNLRQQYPDLAIRFEDFRPTVMSVISDQEEDVNDLFVRLNLTVPVSGPERRNAMRGPIPPLVRELSEHEFFDVCIRFSTDRGQDLNSAAKMLLVEFRRQLVTTKKRDLDRFVKDNEKEPSAKFEKAVRRVENTLT